MRKLAIFCLILVAGSTAAMANIKVKSKQTVGAQSYENTTFIKGKRQRTESMNGMMVNITQCDLRRAIQINPASKTFVVNEFGEITPSGGTAPAKAADQPTVKGGRIISTITVKDTGERKNMFGYPARHLIITMDTESTPDACSPTKSKMETDGWYIDFDFGFDCDQSYAYRGTPTSAKAGCQDKYEIKTVGTAKRGFAVYEKTTMFDQNGKETLSMVNEVVELSKATLDAALFDVPADYRQVSDASQMYASAASSQSYSSQSTGSYNSGTSNASTMSLPNTGNSGFNSPAPQNDTVGAKQSGVIRIGLATVKTGAVGEGITANDLALAVQNTLMTFLRVPNIEIVPLEARLSSAIDAEARQKECDYVIHASVSHKKGGGGFGKMFGSALGSTIARTGIGHTGSAVGNIAGQVATQAVISATSVSSQMKSKDEVTLDIALNRIAGGSALTKQYKAKAKSDGDDIISQVIEQAAEAIVAAIGQ